MPAKNIVLLSDGTGNTGGKGRGTNVWKLYRAVDVHTASRPQVLFYDDGVGTGHFRPLRLLGGACGYGLTQNIRELYSFLVRNYEPGDRIYLFGFSRGAFTVRSLAGLVCRCGIIDRRDRYGTRLERLVVEAMRIYKLCRRRDNCPEAEAFRRQHGVRTPGSDEPEDPSIHFIGVWDTVDAIGLPVDELTDALDRIKPFRFHDCRLLPCVRHSYQALSIDDERLTFHPILWNEQSKGDDQVVEQVWFSGVHSNVGGGYQKDQMSLVSLTWMIDRAKKAGLEFDEELCAEFRREASVHALLHNSRSGLSAYYRYRPRNIRALCADGGAGRPRIHWTVFDRIRRSTADYAPAFIPESYELVDCPEELREELEEREPGRRREALAAARDLIWWRKLLYLAFVWLTLLAIAVSHGLSSGSSDPCRGCDTVDPCESAECLLQPLYALFDLVVWVAPPAVEGWLNAFRLHPGWLGFFALATLVLLFLRTRLRQATVDACLGAWRLSFSPGGKPPTPPAGTTGDAWHRRWARALRRSSIYRFFVTFKKRALPGIVIVAAGLLALGLLGTWVWELCVVPAPAAPHECVAIDRPRALEPGTELTFAFDTRCPKFGSSVILEAGSRYRLTVAPGDVAWKDADYDADLSGLDSRDAERLLYRFFGPLRRERGAPWFELLGQTLDCPGTRFRLGRGPAEHQATRTGRLILFVNDVVCYTCLDRWRLYANNQGTAEVTVRRLADQGG